MNNILLCIILIAFSVTSGAISSVIYTMLFIKWKTIRYKTLLLIIGIVYSIFDVVSYYLFCNI